MKNTDEELKIWEYYEIHPSIDRPLKMYGYWNSKEGIRSDEPSKWIRRKDLQVIICFILQCVFLS